jgi:hypothetical protein
MGVERAAPHDTCASHRHDLHNHIGLHGDIGLHNELGFHNDVGIKRPALVSFIGWSA